jgi:peptidoglycan/xylan/chitin deacetylase (PgdA/CDA1 family)
MSIAPIPVLLYHSVADGEAASGDRFAVSPRRFSEHVAAITASGRVPLTISELASALRGERELPERAVAVTFDDGYADTSDAVALLAAHGLTSTLYVTSSRIGARDGIEVAALEAILAAGAEIGAHTVTHPHLDELRIDVAAREIADSRAAVGQALARPVASFAYPHGAHDARVRTAVIDAGFSSAAAVKNALSHSSDDPFAIARVTIVADTATAAVSELLAGRGVPLAWRGERARTRIYRGVRKARRRASELRAARSTGRVG